MRLGYKMSPESKQKMREAKLRNPVRYWAGRHISEEHNRKLQEGKLKYAPSQKGIIRTDEQKAKISETLKGKFVSGELISPLISMGIIGKTGKDSPNWRGGKTLVGQGIRRSKKYHEWRIEVLQRDNYTCQLCKTRGGKLHVDHVKPFAYFPDLIFEITNARTLCVPCHRKTPTWGAQSVKI